AAQVGAQVAARPEVLRAAEQGGRPALAHRQVHGGAGEGVDPAGGHAAARLERVALDEDLLAAGVEAVERGAAEQLAAVAAQVALPAPRAQVAGSGQVGAVLMPVPAVPGELGAFDLHAPPV